MNLKAPELLLPAGSLQRMRAAYDFGADAVYAGQPRYSLRARNNEFRLEQLEDKLRKFDGRSIQCADDDGGQFLLSGNIVQIVPLGSLADDIGVAVEVNVERDTPS